MDKPMTRKELLDALQEAYALGMAAARETNATSFPLASFEDADIPDVIGAGLIQLIDQMSGDPSEEQLDTLGHWIGQLIPPQVTDKLIAKAEEEIRRLASAGGPDYTNIILRLSDEEEVAVKDEWDRRINCLSTSQLQLVPLVMDHCHDQAVRLEIAFLSPWHELPQASAWLRSWRRQEPAH